MAQNRQSEDAEYESDTFARVLQSNAFYETVNAREFMKPRIKIVKRSVENLQMVNEKVDKPAKKINQDLPISSNGAGTPEQTSLNHDENMRKVQLQTLNSYTDSSSI